MIVDQFSDEGKKSKILSGAVPTRVFFDPKNKRHRASAKHFLETGRWGDVLFKPEHPHVEVPATVLTKLAAHHLKIGQ